MYDPHPFYCIVSIKICQPNSNRHGLGVQHVRAVGVQIQAKVREAGCQVDVNGSCWASQAEVNHVAVAAGAAAAAAAAAAAGRPEGAFLDQPSSRDDQQVPGQRDDRDRSPPSVAEDALGVRRERRDTDDSNNSANGGPRGGRSNTRTRSGQEQRGEHEGEGQLGVGRWQRQRRRRSSQESCSEESYQQRSWSAWDEYEHDGRSLGCGRRSSDEQHGLDSQTPPPSPPPGKMASLSFEAPRVSQEHLWRRSFGSNGCSKKG